MMNDLKSNANLRLAVPFFMVRNMEASLDYYAKGLGFELKIDWRPEGRIEWCWLERGSVSLMLQEYREEWLPKEQLGQGVSIFFICEDALELYHEFLQKGLKPAEPFVGNKMWVVSLKDPDGYNLNFESSTDVAEETKYSNWAKSK